jgi:hypothetical protein
MASRLAESPLATSEPISENASRYAKVDLVESVLIQSLLTWSVFKLKSIRMVYTVKVIFFLD